jgi:hypothetical protein
MQVARTRSWSSAVLGRWGKVKCSIGDMPGVVETKVVHSQTVEDSSWTSWQVSSWALCVGCTGFPFWRWILLF